MGYNEHPVAINLLVAIFGFAVYSMWGMSLKNGFIDTLRHLRDHGPHFVPGSTIPLVQKYTGISQVDYFLTIAQCFFANVADGSAPHLSLLTFYFLSQVTAVVVGMTVESQRSFNSGKPVSWFILWGILMQVFGFGTIMPIYAILHLYTTDRFAATSKHTLGKSLKTLPQAIVIGYILPVALAALPVTPVLHQQFIAAWQFFPVWVSAAMFVNKMFVSPITAASQSRKQLATIYKFGEFLTLWTHRLTIATLTMIYFKPNYFPQYLAESLTFSNVFLPPLPPFSTKVSLIGGASDFLKYDMLNGFLAAIIWQFSISEIYLHFDLIIDVVSKGPGYTFLRITDLRDQILFEIVQSEEEKAIREGYSDPSWKSK